MSTLPSSLFPLPSSLRRGSALLIVLGMIAFMVISAVAFSALMRNSRLPSSYLRRTSSSRHLAKAALAEAIDILDISLGNDPYPYTIGTDYPNGGNYNGIGWAYPRDAANGQVGVVARRNYWRGHVFIGTNSLCDTSETVSTLTLEALAYLPPPFINEARYYSRHSIAGRWRNLGFDAGRYAFSVVDVSDCIDINRIFADRGRNSSDGGRVTLAHVFENTDHSGSGNPDAAAWDGFIAEFNAAVDAPVGQPGANGGGANQGSSSLPFVSLADLNLAIADKQKGWVETMSPFCRFIGTGRDFIGNATDDAAKKVRYMTFVTDSYTPSTNDSNSANYDLCSAQPFPRMRHGTDGGSQLPVVDILENPPLIRQRMYDWFCRADMVSLYDYLDENDIPATLSLPTTERVPMICALQPNIVLDLKMEEKKSNSTPQETEMMRTWIRTYSYKLKLEGDVNTINGLFAFPFRHDKEANGASYEVDYMLRIGLATDSPGLRTVADSPYVVQSGDRDKIEVGGGVMRFHKTDTIPQFNSVKTESDAVKFKGTTFNLTELGNKLNDVVLFTVPVLVRQTRQKDPVTGKTNWIPGGDDLENGGEEVQFDNRNNDFVDPTTAAVHPVDANGKGDGGFNRKFLEATVGSGGGPKTVKVRPYMTLTASVKSSKSGKIVDLVPASYLDDDKYNQIDNSELNDIWNVNGNAGTFPIMTFAGDKDFEFGRGGGQATVKVGGNTVVCPDPRWNFAPENFFTTDQAPDANWYISNCGVDNGGRDCDIFMAVSNQGYMQSVSEFAFLPRLARDFGGGSENTGTMSFTLKTAAGATFEPFAANDFSKLAHGTLMWRTYNLFGGEGRTADGIYDMGIDSLGRGFRINPFTSSKDVMMAALANTPVTWYAASTNLTANNSLADLPASDFNGKYAFSQMNSDAQLYWKDLEKVAEKFVGVFHGNGVNWQRGFHNLDWDGENSDLCGVDFDSTDVDTVLKDVDRKMLYGFWRDSFGVKQQLFLVFVRAEPMMMGGGAIGQTPPQLGARAVALVWRDPNPTQTDVGNQQPRPHRTRVLFYRQFD